MIINTIYEAKTRENVYTFLASLFLLEPNQENIITLQKQLNELLEEKEKIKRFIQTEEEVLELCQEYYDLFFVPSSGCYVPPFEAALKNYQPGKKKPFSQLYNKDTVHVQSCYDVVGFNPWKLNIFQPLKDVKFPDHIGFELAFMALLCANDAKSNQELEDNYNWKRLQHQFLAEHLSQWAKNFSLAVKDNSRGFYEKATVAIMNWIFEDLENLEVIVNRKRGENS